MTKSVDCICIVFLIIFFMPLQGFTQSEAPPSQRDISVSMSAQIVGSIELITIRGISLRDSRPEDGLVHVSPVQNGNSGHMIATGPPNSMVRISFLEEEELINAITSHKLKFDYEVSVNNRNEQATSQIISRESQNQQMNAQGELFIWVGGRVNISDAQPGSYQGEFTVEIEYI